MKNPSLEDKDGALQPQRKVFLAANAEESGATLDVGFDIIRCITQNFLKDDRSRALKFSSRFASGNEEETANPFAGEIRSVSESKLCTDTERTCMRIPKNRAKRIGRVC